MLAKAFSLLGMARRAGKVSWHEDANLSAIREGKVRLLILALDAGAATAKRYTDKCAYYNVPLTRPATREELGKALGTSPRTAVAVLDDGFALKISELLKAE